ncbi:MAG: cation transporter [Lachnospiraceae bacterium]|jgi:cation diffusion facilitator family transporter|nr:cation transporter [Lachnospiraceae bacterium]
MIDFFVHRFIKNYEQTEDAGVRTAYGVLGSVVGIICNLLLFGGKLVAGLVLHSISVTADAFNNLSDAASSVIGFIGVKMASKPADRNHPFGHGRIEYIAALIVSFLVIEVGFTFLKNAFEKICNPEEISFQAVSLAVLLASIGVKLWMAYFNRKLGKRIQSKVMLATATDALGDVITTSATIGSICISHFTGVNIDGYVGLVVALIVMWAGISIAKDTLEPLIGEAVSPEVYQAVTELVESYEGIVGTHDLIVHNYGPTRSLASIHAEVPNDVDIEVSHEIIDRIERDAARKLGIFLVIHMDPVETHNNYVNRTRERVQEVIHRLDPELSIHDFRMVDGKKQINLIFDVVVPFSYQEKRQQELQEQIMKELKKEDSRFQCVMTMEKSYVAEG